MRETGQGPPNRRAGLIEDAPRHRVPVAGGGGYALRIERSPLGPGQPRRRFLRQKLRCAAGDRRAGGDGFKMSVSSAAAQGSVIHHRDVPQLGRQAVRPKEQSTILDHATSDAGADGEVDQVIGAHAGAVAPFGQGGQVGVVAQAHRQTQQPF